VRILHFCNYAERVGGAEVYAHALIAAQRERGHEVALFGGAEQAEIDRPGLRVIQRPNYDAARLIVDPAAKSALQEYLARFRPDLIHAHNYFSVALDVVHELGSCGVPLVQTVHDYQLLCPNSWCVRGDGQPCPGGAGEQCFQHACERNYPYDAWSVLLARIRQSLVATATSRSIAPSGALVERLLNNGWSGVHHLPYFIEFTPVPPVSRAEQEVLYVGRLEREKGVAVLLSAAGILKGAWPELRTTVIGSGSCLVDLQALARKLQIEDRVRFLRGLPREAIAAHYRSASVCVLPSLWAENSPLVAYECMASATPMIGSRIGGIPELIGEAGFTFVPGDARALSDALARFLTLDSGRRGELSEIARRQSLRYSKDGHLDEIERVYSAARVTAPLPTPAFWTTLWPLLERASAQHRSPLAAPSAKALLRRLARELGLPKLLP
jgi:glycosyltransferase involved in cell wall biosynthesis